jgi:hypothetical protein
MKKKSFITLGPGLFLGRWLADQNHELESSL